MKNNGKYFTVVCGLRPTSDPNLFAAFPPDVYPFKYRGHTFFAHREKRFRDGWIVSEQQTGRMVITIGYKQRNNAIAAAKEIIDRYADTLAEIIEKNKIQVVDIK